VHDRGDDGDADEHAYPEARAGEEIQAEHQRQQRTADVDGDDRRALGLYRRRHIRAAEHGHRVRRKQALDGHGGQRKIDVGADEREEENEEHVAWRDPDLPVRPPEHLPLHDESEHAQREQEEREEERGRG
jgi:hypothetical protein